MKELVIKQLKEKEIIKYGHFTLKSGRTSKYYINLRESINYPSLFHNIITLLSDEVKKIKPDTLLGISYTGIPLATGVSLRTGIPFCYNVKEKKEYGIPSKIIGKPEGNVLAIDDLITSGTSFLETIEGIENVSGLLVLINRDEGGKENLEKANFKLHSIIQKNEIL